MLMAVPQKKANRAEKLLFIFGNPTSGGTHHGIRYFRQVDYCVGVALASHALIPSEKSRVYPCFFVDKQISLCYNCIINIEIGFYYEKNDFPFYILV